MSISVTIEKLSGGSGYQTWLHSGAQHFSVGPPFDLQDEVDWYADQLRKALKIEEPT